MQKIWVSYMEWLSSYNHLLSSSFHTPLYTTQQPITFSSDKYDSHFDYISSVENINIIDSRGNKFDGCMASNMGVKNLVITDMDGSLDPSGTSGTGGSLVSDYPCVTGLTGVECTSVLSMCMAYCPGACLRAFSYKVEQFGTENWTLEVRVLNIIVGYGPYP